MTSSRFSILLNVTLTLCSVVDAVAPLIDLCTFEEMSSQQSQISKCPMNMVVGNCTCLGTCVDPFGCHGNCTDSDICICPPDGFLMNGEDCVPMEDCGCYVEDVGILQQGEVFINNECSMRCVCSQGDLVCDYEFRCSDNATCQQQNLNDVPCICDDGFYGNGLNCTLALDCADYHNAGFVENGTYLITPKNWTRGPFEVYCDMATSGGGWTVFQRRVDGSVDFYLNWADYKEGFGDVDQEHWLGNDKIHLITHQREYKLRIDLSTDDMHHYAEHDIFRIGNEENNYTLTDIIQGTGSAARPLMIPSLGVPWSTKDRDNADNVEGTNDFECAVENHGAFWYDATKGCSLFNPNGQYNGSELKGIYWKLLTDHRYVIKFVEMKLRPY
ncbi:fibrinogen-like protein A [Apostichopus japonicus]|uniref:fibrinogen-like protein A n=1 Tax=Stichopus japonicus TaxID=307972 RepID=UPI003AB48CC8